MKTIEELLKNLARPEVLEFGLVTNRLPSVNIGGKFEPVDDEAPSTERLMQMLVTMGGSRYVDSLTDKPVQWTTRLDGVGVIAVAAIMRKEVVQARFTVAKRESASARSPAATAQQPAARPSENPPAASSRGVPAATPSPQPVAVKAQPASGALPHAQPASTQSRVPPAATNQPSSSTITAAKAAPQVQPQVTKNATSATSQAAARSQPAPAPSEEEWEDDDEPTLQTLSPPVSGAPGALAPKPPRRAEAISHPEADIASERAREEQAAQEKALEERAAQEKAAQEKAAQEKATQEKAAQEKGAHEKAAQEKAAQEKAAQEKAAQEKAAQEKAAQERAAQERATLERVAKERAAQEQRAAQERVARDRAAAADALRAKQASSPGIGRRISTPTSVDAVDVEITTHDAGSRVRPVTIDIDLDADGGANTASIPGTVDGAKNTGGANAGPTAPAASAAAAVPSTTSAALAEKDRPRVDASVAIDSFLAMAVAARASDLHIVAGRPILLRIASDLLPRTQSVAAEQVERIAKEIVPTRLRETLEKEGSCDFAVEHPTHGRFRVNVSRQRTGYMLNLRVVPKEMPTLATLGLPDAVANGLRHQRGLILVTGPGAHGKSSTVAALVDQLNRETGRHIVTIEEPIEHVHTRKKGFVSQRDVGLHSRTKARAIQSALRDDADVVVIGEMRDAESVRLALFACEGGRLVLGTMNMPSAAKTIDRILDLFSPSEKPWVRSSLASSLRLIVGQRLVPSTDRTRFHAAVELLPWSVALYGLVREGRTDQIPSLQQRGKPLGVIRLDESLAELVRAQKVTADVAKQFAESPSDFETQAARPAAGAAQARKA